MTLNDAIYEEENKPHVEESCRIYSVRFPRPTEVKRDEVYWLYVSVDEYDYAEIMGYSSFGGKSYKNMDFEDRKEVHDFLIEWEILEWRRIGPEDSELFATKEFLDDIRR